MGLENFHFLRPWCLLLILLSFINLRQSLKASGWTKVIDPKLLPHLLKKGQAQSPNWISKSLWPLFVISLSVAMAGPSYKKIPDDQSFRKAPLIIALEVSEHMVAKDIGPNRLKRAIYKIEDLLKRYTGAEIALVAFSGDAHIVVPLSDDHRTILSLAKTLSPDVMPIKGVSASGLISAIKSMAENNPSSRLLVMSSTNFSGTGLEVKKELNSLGLNTTLWAFATAVGAPYSGTNISKLRDDVVENFSFPSKIVQFTPDGQDVDQVVADIESLDVARSEKKMIFDSWYDEGPYVLAFAMAIFLLAMFFRRNTLWFCGFFLMLPITDAKAGLIDWFLRKDQQAQIALEKGDPKSAAKLFEDDLRKGSAYYQAKMYDQAIEHLAQVKSADGRYNLGNALAKKGQYKEAIKAYEEALAIDPAHKDAKANKELIEKLLKDQPPKDQEQKPEQQEKQEQDKKEQEKQEQKQDQKDQQGSGQKDNEQKAPPKEEQKPKEEPKKSDQAKDQKEQKAEPKKEEQQQLKEDKEKGLKPKESSLDKEDEYRLEKLGTENSSYLRRKFLFETRTKKERGR